MLGKSNIIYIGQAGGGKNGGALGIQKRIFNTGGAEMLKLSLEIKIKMMGYIPIMPHALANALTQEGWQILRIKAYRGKDPGDVVY